MQPPIPFLPSDVHITHLCPTTQGCFTSSFILREEVRSCSSRAAAQQCLHTHELALCLNGRYLEDWEERYSVSVIAGMFEQLPDVYFLGAVVWLSAR